VRGWLLSLGKTTSNKKGTTLEQLEIPPLSFFFFFFLPACSYSNQPLGFSQGVVDGESSLCLEPLPTSLVSDVQNHYLFAWIDVRRWGGREK